MLTRSEESTRVTLKPQEGHEGEVKAQEEQGEDANSLHEESHVSNRHMTWWHNAWWVRSQQRTTLADGARPSASVACSHESRAGSARDRADRRKGPREKWEQGRKGEKRKQHSAPRDPLAHNHNPNDTNSGSSNAATVAAWVMWR